jgi:hypothetical protein
MSGKYLSKEQRMDSNFIFAVIDATIAEWGRARLDCGHETDGTEIVLIPQKDKTYLAVCPPCEKEYMLKKEEDKVGD